MKIAIIKNNKHYHYAKGKMFMVFGDSIYNIGEIYCSLDSDTTKNYMDIVEYSNILQKECTNEIIRYIFSNDTKSSKVIKEYYNKDGVYKKTKEVKEVDSDFYIKLLNDGFIPINTNIIVDK